MDVTIALTIADVHGLVLLDIPGLIQIIQITCLSELQGALVFVFAIVVSFFLQKQKTSLSWSATDKLHSSVYHCK